MSIFTKRRNFFGPRSQFLPIFTRQAVFAIHASSSLRDLVSTNDHFEWHVLEKEVKQCEIQGDALLSEFYEELYEKLIPPMDRDDLQTISLEMDQFLDAINTAAKSVILYSPKKIDQVFSDMAQYVCSEAESLKAIIELCNDMSANFSAITMQCDRITELEHAADDAYEEYIGEIFKNEKDAVELMKYKNMAEVFEAATDSAKKVSDHIRKLLLRYI